MCISESEGWVSDLSTFCPLQALKTLIYEFVSFYHLSSLIYLVSLFLFSPTHLSHDVCLDVHCLLVPVAGTPYWIYKQTRIPEQSLRSSYSPKSLPSLWTTLPPVLFKPIRYLSCISQGPAPLQLPFRCLCCFFFHCLFLPTPCDWRFPPQAASMCHSLVIDRNDWLAVGRVAGAHSGMRLCAWWSWSDEMRWDDVPFLHYSVKSGEN